MGWLFHKHIWKEIARTYAPAIEIKVDERYGLFSANDILAMREQKIRAVQGTTTILWECQDPECRQLRKEQMLGKTE